MKFKRGDRVVVLDKCISPAIPDMIKEHAGGVYTIECCFDDCTCHLAEPEVSMYWWHEDNFALASDLDSDFSDVESLI